MAIQAAVPTPEVALGPLLAWGKLAITAGSVVAAVLLMRARFNDFVKVVVDLRDEVTRGFESVRDIVGDHETRITVLEDREDRERRPSGGQPQVR